jgi:hypothetical protein
MPSGGHESAVALPAAMSKKVTLVALKQRNLCDNRVCIEGIRPSYRPDAVLQVCRMQIETQGETG